MLMFSGTMKVLGALFLALGVILSVVGAMGLMAAALDESENQDRDEGFLGFGGEQPDDDRTERNAAVGAGAAATLGTGITTLIIGTIFLIIGIATTRRQEGQQQQQQVVIVQGDAEPPKVQ